MYTHPALLNPHLISCSLTGDSSNQAPPPWRTVKWFELEYVLTGEGGGFLKSCQPLRLMLDLCFKIPSSRAGCPIWLCMLKTYAILRLCLRVRALIGLQPLALGAPLRSSIYPDGCMRGVPQKAGRLRLPPGIFRVGLRSGRAKRGLNMTFKPAELKLNFGAGRALRGHDASGSSLFFTQFAALPASEIF